MTAKSANEGTSNNSQGTSFRSKYDTIFMDCSYYCVFFIFTLGSDVIFNVSLPRRGIYYYSIFACDTDQADVYNNIISVKIRCSDVSTVFTRLMTQFVNISTTKHV